MKFFRTAAVLVSLSAACLQAAVDPALLGLIMPEAKAISGVQLEQSRTSPLGQFLLGQLGPLAFEDLKRMTGFDPRTDLSEVVSASAGPAETLLAGRGMFQPARIVALAQAGGAPLTTYRGMTLISIGPAPMASVVFLDANTVVGGTTSAVQGAIDRWFGATPYSGPLAAKVGEVSASHGWSVATGLSDLIPVIPNAPPQFDMIRNLVSTITQLSGGVVFGDQGVQVKGKLETRSAQDAQSMADVLRLLATMAPQPGLANAATFTNAGSVVNIQVSLTEQQVEQLLKPPVSATTIASR